METAQHKHGEFTKHYEDSMFQVSKSRMFSVELVTKEHHLKEGVNTVDIIIHDKEDRDVVGADVEVVPWMPDMGHGVPEKPDVMEKGGGLYSVENIVLMMGGHWEIRVQIKSGGVEDAVVFDFPDVKAKMGHEHMMMKAPAPSDLDLSTTRMSDQGSLKVSYKSDIMPVPINKIHSWTLKVETADGMPVTDAEISIDGDMPEHGHGLPTQPEVTQDFGGGEYLVEGMKFSMPGWWSLKFIIRTQDTEERVMFNLILKE